MKFAWFAVWMTLKIGLMYLTLPIWGPCLAIVFILCTSVEMAREYLQNLRSVYEDRERTRKERH